jgi:hypothetical protein
MGVRPIVGDAYGDRTFDFDVLVGVSGLSERCFADNSSPISHPTDASNVEPLTLNMIQRSIPHITRLYRLIGTIEEMKKFTSQVLGAACIT